MTQWYHSWQRKPIYIIIKIIWMWKCVSWWNLILGYFHYCKTLIIRVTLFSRKPSLNIYSRDFIFATHHIFFYNPYITNYWRGLYFRVSILSRIYAKIKSSRIISVLQYNFLLFQILTNWTMDNVQDRKLVYMPAICNRLSSPIVYCTLNVCSEKYTASASNLTSLGLNSVLHIVEIVLHNLLPFLKFSIRIMPSFKNCLNSVR